MRTRNLVAVIAGVVVLISLYFVVLPGIQPAGRAGVRELDLEIKGRKLTVNPPLIKLVQGDQVTFRIRADEEGEFHVHTYDAEVDVERGSVALLKFNATLAGRYDLEWHLPKKGQEKGEEIVVGAIEVSPMR